MNTLARLFLFLCWLCAPLPVYADDQQQTAQATKLTIPRGAGIPAIQFDAIIQLRHALTDEHSVYFFRYHVSREDFRVECAWCEPLWSGMAFVPPPDTLVVLRQGQNLSIRQDAYTIIKGGEDYYRRDFSDIDKIVREPYSAIGGSYAVPEIRHAIPESIPLTVAAEDPPRFRLGASWKYGVLQEISQVVPFAKKQMRITRYMYDEKQQLRAMHVWLPAEQIESGPMNGNLKDNQNIDGKQVEQNFKVDHSHFHHHSRGRQAYVKFDDIRLAAGQIVRLPVSVKVYKPSLFVDRSQWPNDEQAIKNGEVQPYASGRSVFWCRQAQFSNFQLIEPDKILELGKHASDYSLDSLTRSYVDVSFRNWGKPSAKVTDDDRTVIRTTIPLLRERLKDASSLANRVRTLHQLVILELLLGNDAQAEMDFLQQCDEFAAAGMQDFVPHNKSSFVWMLKNWKRDELADRLKKN